MVPKHKIYYISANSKAILLKLGISKYCTLGNISRGEYFDVALATLLVPDLFHAEMKITYSNIKICIVW